jgi:exonuclease VII small subunit
MREWNEKQLEDFSALIKKGREALNEFEHLMRLVRDQSESLENIQPRIQELLSTVSETTAQLQKYLQPGNRK